MKTENMTSTNGNKVANQFIITDDNGNVFFQSYKSVIVKVPMFGSDSEEIELDQKYWNYSNTTGKYRNIFLNENITETRKKIKSGEYKLTDLNAEKVTTKVSSYQALASGGYNEAIKINNKWKGI